MNQLMHRDLMPALALTVLGSWALLETRDMSILGAVFPRLASLGMLLGGLALGVRALLLAPPVRLPEGEVSRPILFLILLFAWAVLLPVTGFIATSCVAAVLAMILSSDTQPNLRAIAIQTAALITIVLLVAFLFGEVLKVKLP